MFFTRRLYTLKRRVQLKIGNEATQTYGFKHLIRAMKYNYDCQALMIQGTNNEYMRCNQRWLEKYQNFVLAAPDPVNGLLEFLELNRCNFD